MQQHSAIAVSGPAHLYLHYVISVETRRSGQDSSLYRTVRQTHDRREELQPLPSTGNAKVYTRQCAGRRRRHNCRTILVFVEKIFSIVFLLKSQSLVYFYRLLFNLLGILCYWFFEFDVYIFESNGQSVQLRGRIKCKIYWKQHFEGRNIWLWSSEFSVLEHCIHFLWPLCQRLGCSLLTEFHNFPVNMLRSVFTKCYSQHLFGIHSVMLVCKTELYDN